MPLQHALHLKLYNQPLIVVQLCRLWGKAAADMLPARVSIWPKAPTSMGSPDMCGLGQRVSLTHESRTSNQPPANRAVAQGCTCVHGDHARPFHCQSSMLHEHPRCRPPRRGIRTSIVHGRSERAGLPPSITATHITAHFTS